jgi:hypothetical protein
LQILNKPFRLGVGDLLTSSFVSSAAAKHGKNAVFVVAVHVLETGSLQCL